MAKPTPVKPTAADQDPRIGVYVCHCGLNIQQSVDCHRVAETVATGDGVVISKDIVYACSEPGQQQIKQDILDNGLDRVVIASCSPRLHEATFKKMIDSVGLNPYTPDRGYPATHQKNPGNRRRHCRHPGRPGSRRQRLRRHPGGEEPLGRRGHGSVGQNLSHHGLLDLNLRS